MITVRKIQEKDRKAIHAICEETSSYDLSQRNMKNFLFLMYSDYYILNEPDFCFAAEDENGKVIGYILCAKNFKSYLKAFRADYLPKIDRLGIKYAIMARSEILVHAFFCRKNKAHLHIDLTEGCRRKGVGTKLMLALKAELAKNDVHSLMLSCASSNKAAISFYKKNNFKTILKIFSGNIMICKF